MKKLARVTNVYYSIDLDFIVDLELELDNKLKTIRIVGYSLKELSDVISLGCGWHLGDICGCDVLLYYKGKTLVAVSNEDGEDRIKCRDVSGKD